MSPNYVGRNMNTIMEADLVDYARNKAITVLHIIQRENGSFEIEAELTWKEGRVKLITQKKEVRTWANATRLIEHIKECYGAIPLITIKPYNKNSNLAKL